MSDISVVSLDGPTISVVSERALGVHVVEATVGLQGPPGPGGADLNATHVQAAAASVWVVPHSLGKRPSVTVVDSAGDPVEGTVGYVDGHNLTITFSAALSGLAFLN